MDRDECILTQSQLNLPITFGVDSKRLCALRFELGKTEKFPENLTSQERGAACKGDSGGPLFCLDIGDDGYKIQGQKNLLKNKIKKQCGI